MIALLEEFLLEALIGLVVTYNVGMHLFFWRYINDVEDELGENKSMIKDNRNLIREIRNHYFGTDADRTNGGALFEFQEEFENLHDRLEEAEESRKKEHQEVSDKLNKLTQVIAEEESVEEISFSDFET